MPHDISLISTLAAGFALALVLGFVATKLRLPPLVGYLLAGVAIGPSTPGFVADLSLAGQLAEIGVMLLMFGVGLHFSVADLLSVKRIAIPGAIVQIAVAVAMGAGVAHWWGWPIGQALVFGLCLSVASTVVLLKALEARGLLETMNGRIAIGWLVVEDLVMVLVLVLLPAFATMLGGQSAGQTETVNASASLWQTVGVTLAKVAAFIASMMILGKRLFPALLWWVAKTGSRELFTLSVIACAVGVAFAAAKLFDVSFALGAFFAGMMMQGSEYSHRAADESLPLRDAFAVLFFVSVGMLFDPAFVLQEPVKLAIVVGIIVMGKTLAAVALVLMFQYPLSTALTVGASLAQIGEFSFILAGVGMSLGLLTQEGQNLILAGALVSIALNSALFNAMQPLLNWLKARSHWAAQLDSRDDPLAQLPDSIDASRLTHQIVLVGYGEVGQRIAATLIAEQRPFVVADTDRDRVEALRAQQIPAVCGDLTDPAVLIQAHIARASTLIITDTDSMRTRQMADIARTLNPGVRLLACGANAEEAARLAHDIEGEWVVADQALAEAMLSRVVLAEGHAPSPRHHP